MPSIIKRITDTAERLYELRRSITQKEEESRRELEAMKTERDAVQALLLAELNKNGLSSIKVKSGDSFSKGVRKSIEIVFEPHALRWATQNKAVSINKLLVAQLLKDKTELPPCFKFIETEFVAIRHAKSV